MALHSGFFSFLERRETTVGGTVCLDLQSWMCISWTNVSKTKEES